MTYRVLYLAKVKNDIIPAIPRKNREQILTAICERLAVDPAGVGKPLQYTLKGYWRLRVGKWRVVYKITDDCVVIYDIVIRRDAYGD